MNDELWPSHAPNGMVILTFDRYPAGRDQSAYDKRGLPVVADLSDSRKGDVAN